VPLATDLAFNYSKGLKELVNLKKLTLSYSLSEPIPVPIVSEQRRWDDPSCQICEDIKIGFKKETGYPFSLDCYQEILNLSLDEFTWGTHLPILDALDLQMVTKN